MVGPASFSGQGLLQERAVWFGLCAGFTFLASCEWGLRGKLLTVSVSAMVCAVGLLNGAILRRDLAPLLRSYDEAARLVEPNKTFLYLCYCAPPSSWYSRSYSSTWYSNPAVLSRLRIWPLAHAGEITALGGRDFLVANYEATTSSFPVEYLPEVNPAVHAATLYENVVTNPKVVDLADYEAKVGRPIDYVLVWGGRELNAQKAPQSALDKQLQARYTLIYAAPVPSLLSLFRRMDVGEPIRRAL